MIQDILSNIQAEISDWLRAQGVAEVVLELERSAQPEFGEYSSNVAMRYAKELKKNPFDLAGELVAFLQEQEIGGLEKAEAVKPGFLNFYLTVAAKIQHLTTIQKQGADFGNNKLHHGEKWVVEYVSPNPNKAMHLGHLRNALVGSGIINLLKSADAEVVSDVVYNNRGIAIAKVMYGFLVHMKKIANNPTDIVYWVEHSDEWFTPEEKGVKPDIFVTECYVLGERDAKNNEEIDQLVRQMVVDWEAGDTATWQLWELVLQYAYSGIEEP